MLQPGIAMIGIGEIGGILAKGFLRSRHPVYPVTRGMDLGTALESLPRVEGIVVAVGEKDLHEVLSQMPHSLHERLMLIQNELLPRDWEAHGIQDPTIASIWFEKKPGKAEKVLVPTPVHGPRAGMLESALSAVNIPARQVPDEEVMLQELVIKNLYILTTNIAGLKVGGDVQTLWDKHRDLAEAVAREVIAIQEWLVGKTLDHDRLFEGMLAGFEGDPEHQCMGRSAPARRARALALAEEAGIDTPTIRSIHPAA
ncbi:MAG: hypothetical protein ACP5DC_07325 [Halothiobacillaceae bacterium]